MSGTGVTHDVGGTALVAFSIDGELIRTWQQPTQMCQPGTWTLTSLPSGPPNDQLELVTA
jgi:hypothetical protein